MSSAYTLSAQPAVETGRCLLESIDKSAKHQICTTQASSAPNQQNYSTQTVRKHIAHGNTSLYNCSKQGKAHVSVSKDTCTFAMQQADRVGSIRHRPIARVVNLRSCQLWASHGCSQPRVQTIADMQSPVNCKFSNSQTSCNPSKAPAAIATGCQYESWVSKLLTGGRLLRCGAHPLRIWILPQESLFCRCLVAAVSGLCCCCRQFGSCCARLSGPSPACPCPRIKGRSRLTASPVASMQGRWPAG